MTYAFIADLVSLILIVFGALLILAAAIGVARFKDTMSRVHAVTKPQTTGLILMIIGAFIRVTGDESFGVAERGDLGFLILLVLFAMITTPVTAQRLTRVARREGLYGAKEDMSRNDRPGGTSSRKKENRTKL